MISRTPPPKPSWYETFCKTEEEKFHREFYKHYDDLISRYIESRRNFRIGIDKFENSPISAAAWAVLAIYRHEQNDTLRVLGYDCPYKQ